MLGLIAVGTSDLPLCLRSWIAGEMLYKSFGCLTRRAVAVVVGTGVGDK
jgi:hypothetical protein